MASLMLRDVSKVYPGDVAAVRQFSIDVADGDCLTVVGPSGCGKSTLLRLIAGLERPTTGEIELDGCSMRGVAASRRNVAMVLQGNSLYPHWTVRENLAFAQHLKGSAWQAWWGWCLTSIASARTRLNQGRDRDLIQQTALGLRIEHLLDRRPEELSGGERQRASLAKSMIRHPAVFLLDEPLSNIDPPLRVALRDEFVERQRRDGITTVYVTHDPIEALACGTRVAVMRQGELIETGSPEQLARQPRLRATVDLLSDEPVNWQEAAVEGGLRLRTEAVVLELPAQFRACLAGRSRVVLGVRPCHVQARPWNDQGDPGATSLRLAGRVVRQQWLAGRREVRVSLDGAERSAPWRARWTGLPAAAPGDAVWIEVDGNEWLLFDWETGSNLAVAVATTPTRRDGKQDA